MEINDELKDIDNKNCTCCYFDGITKIEDFDFDNILLDAKPDKILWLIKFQHKTLIGAMPSRIRFDKTDGFIRVYFLTTKAISMVKQRF